MVESEKFLMLLERQLITQVAVAVESTVKELI
jgi:hypothetical protein